MPATLRISASRSILTPPLAKLWAPVPDPQRQGNLIVKYEATDKNLANNPITLEWAESLTGEWNTIAADIKNEGRYSWQPPAKIPVQVYMRVQCATSLKMKVSPSPRKSAMGRSQRTGRKAHRRYRNS